MNRTETSLAPYTMRLISKDTHRPIRLADLDSTREFAEVLRQALLSSAAVRVDSTQKFMSVDRVDREERDLWCWFYVGEYGVERAMFNAQTYEAGDSIGADWAPSLPYMAHIRCSPERDEAVALLQRHKSRGVKGVFEYAMWRFFVDNYPDIRFEMKRLVPRKIVKHYINSGRVVKVRFVKFGLPSDAWDNMEGAHNEDDFASELVVKNRRRGIEFPIRRPLREWAEKRRKVDRFWELKNYEFDTVKIELAFPKGRRTVDLARPDLLTYYEDITSELEYDSRSGMPLPDALQKASRSLMEDLEESLYHSAVPNGE